MPTQRPFFANFFSAFRARTNPTFQAKSSTTTGAISPSGLAASAHVSTTTATATSTSPRAISTKASNESNLQQNSSTNATAAASRPLNTSPFSTAAITSTSPGSHFYGPHLPKSSGPPSPGPHNANISMSPQGTSTPMTRGRQRRGSDSSNSSGGFMDTMGTEKWYIGGRTAGGDERFYTLGLVTNGAGKRVRSLDRLSL